jgi:DedD protein
MASTGSPEASEIRSKGRRRLIGAIALVVLAVVFVPMVLDSEPKPAGKEPSAAIPSRDNAPPLPPPAPAPKVVPAPPIVAATVTPKTAEPKPAEAAPAKAPESRVLAPQPPASMVPPAAPPAAAMAPAKLEGFAVQVGAFRDEAKLKQLREKLASANVVHYTERLESKAGPLTRLRAGPFATREEAEAALVKLKRSAVEGKVVPLP